MCVQCTIIASYEKKRAKICQCGYRIPLVPVAIETLGVFKVI